MDPSILDKFEMSEDIRTAILKAVELRLTPQPVKIRSDFEVIRNLIGMNRMP